MHNIEIRRPCIEDAEELNQFFQMVIKDTFAKEGLADLFDDIKNEVESKNQYLKCDLDTNGEKRYFYIAIDQSSNKIIGTIEYGPASDLINQCSENTLKDINEIGTVFVLPEYQKRGIGKLLWNVMFLTFVNRGISEFCLDSGYTTSQKIWQKKFGEPDYLLEDYWGQGNHHMIWRRSTKDMSIIF